MMTEYLPFFVYGTLLPNQPNAYFWGDAIVSQETAVFPNGRLYDFGNYPMLIEAGDLPVKGMLVRVDEAQYKLVMLRLDGLEGYNPTNPTESDYVRAKRDVQLENGRWQTAWVYLGQLHFQPSIPIVKDGDWVAHVAHKREDVQSWWQTVDSVAGLHKKSDKS